MSILHLCIEIWLPTNCPIFIAGTRFDFDFSYLNRVLSAVANHPGQAGTVVRVWRDWSWLDAEAVRRKMSQVLRLNGEDLALACRALVGRSRLACALASSLYNDLLTKKSEDKSHLTEHLRSCRRSIVKELEKLVQDEPNFSVALADYFLGLHRGWPGLVSVEAFQPQRDGVFHTRARAQDWISVDLRPDAAKQQASGASDAAAAWQPLAHFAMQSFVLKHPEQLLGALANRVFGRATPQAGAAELDRLVALLLVFLSRDGSAAGKPLSVAELISKLLCGVDSGGKAEAAVPQWVRTLVLPRLDHLRTSDLVDFVRWKHSEVRPSGRSRPRRETT